MEMNIVSTFVHEILHILGLNTSSIPFAVTEGFVELIAQTIMKQDPYFIKHSKLFRYAFLAYPDITLGMNLLVNKLYTNGIDMDVLIMAFGMGDRNSLSLIIDKMVEVYGGEVTDEILRVTAEDPYSFGEYMESLEKEK